MRVCFVTSILLHSDSSSGAGGAREDAGKKIRKKYLFFMIIFLAEQMIHNIISISYDTFVRDVAGWEPRAVGLRAWMSINRNIPSGRCHNWFIFCCEMVQVVSPGSPGSNQSLYWFFLPAFFPQFVTSSYHRYRNPRGNQYLVSMFVVSFCDQSSSSVGQSWS